MNQENKEIPNERERAGELPAEKGHPPVEENEADIFPMSFAQRRMWFFYQLDPADSAYNVPLAIRLTGRLRREILERCINALIERHEGLRTTFKLVDDQPVQVVWPELSLPLPLVDLTGSTEEEIERSVAEQARRPFDLVAGPVIRTTLFRLGEHEHIFLLNCHHIAVDGWALGIFYRELQTLYNAYMENTFPNLPALPIQYADFTQWQLRKLQGETLEKLLHYWKRQLGGNLPTLRLPVEQSRQGVRSARGARLPVVHSPQTLEKLHQFCRRTGATLFMVLLAAFQTLLHRYSGQDDILVGSPIANRNRVEIEGIIGFFANTLVLRTDLSGDPTFLDLLERVREVTLGAYAHQDLPFERLVEELQPERSLKQNPLFQHIFALQKPPEIARKFAGLQAELIEYQSNIIKFDLEFILWESAGELTGFMNYNQDLFSAETIAHMIEHWLILVDDAVSCPTKHVSELALMSALEWRQVLRETRPASSQETNEVSLLHCFEQQVARTPEKPALLAGEILLNYQHLARKVYRLARSLRSWGVKAEVPVGLLMDHSIDEVVCLLAILKAGGACVPLDPTIPPELLSFIIKDANLPILLTKQRYLHHLPPAHPELVVLCTSEGEIAQGQGHEDGDLPDDTEPGKLASILYVADRGILLEHGGLLEHVRWRQATFPISPEDTVLLSPLPGSMPALWEILWSLLQGACLYLSGEEQREDPAAFWRFVNEHQASVIHTTPEQLKAFPATFGVQARLLLCYGEQLAPATIETLRPHFNGTLHLLAPLPEAATCIAYASLAPEERFAGEPLRAVSPTHVQRYILDKYRQPLPVGIPGELFVASGGLARGYTHGTSDERFFTHAFNLAPALPGRIFQTRQYARLLRDGTLELLASLDRRVTLHGYELSLPLIEEALLRNASVVDCAVLLREAALGTPVLVAYVVLNSSLSVERLEAHMHQLLPPLMAPAFYVPVSAIPLTRDGEIDEPALCSLEIIEPELLRHWEERLLSIPEIERVAVLAQERREELPLLHLSDLFSDWREMFGQTAAPRSVSAALSSVNETPSAQERKLAQSSGAELVIEPHAPRTLAEALERSARLAPTEKIIYLQQDETELSHTHRELLEEAECILMGLRQHGLQPQHKILFQLELAQDFIAAFWGCVLGGFVPVPLSIAPTYAQANSAVSKLQSAWQALDHPVVLASSHLTAPLRAMAEEADLAGFQVLDIQRLRACPPEHSWHQSDPHETALLLLTSGSTGAPKGVMLSHHNLLCRSAATIQMNRFTRQDVLLNWMPLDHVGGIVMYHLLGMYLSCRQIHVSIQTILQDPLKWLDLVDHYRVTNTWAPNFAYGLVNAQAAELARRRWDLSSLGFILNGGEAVVARTARRFLELLRPHGLPATAMHPAWGMSETSSGVTFSQDFTLEKTTDAQEHVEVGAPIPGVSLRIVDANDQVVEEGITGRLQVKGLPVTRGYYQRPDLHAETFTSDGWFNTGDLGMILNGKLTITGRAKDTIIVNGVNIYSHDVEALIEELEHIEVSYTAVCAVRNAASSTDRVAVFFVTPLSERQQQRELMLRIREQVTRRVGINVDFFLPVTRDDIPKTAIGKIQRALLRERFQQGDFDAVLKQVDIILNEQARTLPDWFYQATWVQRKGREQGYTLPTTPTLLFLDQGGLGARLREELSAPCICVEQGADFARLDASRYAINPALPEHYHRLLMCLRDEGLAIGQIIHLWTYGEEKNGAPEDLEALRKVQCKGTYSLLFLVQAFAALPPTGRIMHCYVVSSAMHTLTPESTWNPAAAPLRGFLKTISLELPWFQCHSIDLESACIEQNSANILSECSLPSGENEVAYRGQKRFVMALRRVRLAKRPAASSPLKERGIYLVTGGLGGIGTLLISYLSEHLRARVVAVGKTSLPERDAWPDHLASESTLARRIRHYQALEASGGEFFYRSVDITDVAGLRRVIAEAEERWQEPLSGVFHLAGEGNLAYHWEVAEEHRVASETLETFESMFRPKVYGTWALSQALKEHPQIPFIAFSSVNSLFGGASFSAYSAANSFLDAFLRARYQQGQEATYCLNWSLWDNIGMSEGNPAYASDAAHTQGYVTIARDRGLASLLAILAHAAHFTVIGLDRSSPHIQRYLHSDPRQVQQIQAYFTTHGEALPLAKLQSLEVKDRCQAASRCYFQQLAHLPSTPTGEIDLEQLRGSLAKNQHTPQANALPVTELEHTIAAIWQEVLGLETVSIYDNFFSLGGHSLRMSQVHSKLQSALKQTLSMVDLFKYPTIQTLAQFLSQGEQEEEVFAESYARADIRRERYQRRARHLRGELQEN